MNDNNYVVQTPESGVYEELLEPIKINTTVNEGQTLCLINKKPIIAKKMEQ